MFNNNNTLCIPRVCKNIKKKQIFDVFNTYNFGKIKKIDIIENRGKNSNIVHVHYSYWHNNTYVNNIKQKLMNNLNIKIFYDNPWFWIIYLHKANTQHTKQTH